MNDYEFLNIKLLEAILKGVALLIIVKIKNLLIVIINMQIQQLNFQKH